MITRTLILTLSLAAAGAPAVAAETETVVANVRTDDLNLTRTAGRERLDLRIRNAVRRACNSAHRGAADRADEAACVATALADADHKAARAIARAQDGTQLALLIVETSR